MITDQCKEIRLWAMQTTESLGCVTCVIRVLSRGPLSEWRVLMLHQKHEVMLGNVASNMCHVQETYLLGVTRDGHLVLSFLVR